MWKGLKSWKKLEKYWKEGRANEGDVVEVWSKG